MSNKQIAFMQAMLEESTITKAADRAGISRKTAYKYLNNPEFMRELNSRRGACLDSAVRYLQGKLSLCNETLVNIIEDPEAGYQTKINAINSIYTNCKAMTETAEIITRLEQIERDLADQGNEE